MATQFRYNTLSATDNMRLILLGPGREDEPLKIELLETSLDSNPQYVALSYVWGTEGATQPIEIGLAVVDVRPSLYGALKNLRARGIRRLWADDLSINQHDAEECAAQLGLMTRIYRSAEKVIIHLGEWQANESKELGRVLYSVLGRAFAQSFDPQKRVRDTEPLQYDHGVWRILLKMLEDPWFTRVWTVRESVIARRGVFVCGDMLIDQQCFFLVVKYLCNNPESVFAIEEVVGPTRARLALNRCMALSACQKVTIDAAGRTDVCLRPLPIFDLMVMFGTAAARYPGDLLSALADISREGNDENLQQHLGGVSSVTSLEVARYEVRKGRGMALLYVASYLSDNDDLPSWVPRSGRLSPYPLVYIDSKGFCFSNIVSASRDSASIPFLGGIDCKLLVVHGDMFDSIESLGKIRTQPTTIPTNSGHMFREVIDYVAEILAFLKTCRAWIVGEMPLTTALRVAACDGWQEKTKADPEKLLFGICYLVTDMIEYILSPMGQLEMANLDIKADPWLFKDAKQGFPSLNLVAKTLRHNRTALSKAESLRQYAVDFTNMVIPQCVHRRVGRTRGGRICCLPSDSAIGDQLAILAGCEVPVVLRRSGNHYSVVGPCYVHGIMYGEIWKGGDQLEEIYLA